MHPDGVVARSVGDDGIRRQRLAQVRHDLAHLKRPRGPRRGAVRAVLGIGGLGPGGPAPAIDRRHLRQGGRHGARIRVDGQPWLVHAAELLGVGMHVHQRLLRTRHLEERIAAGRHFSQAGAEHEQQIGLADTPRESGVDPQSEIPGEQRMLVVEIVLAAERSHHRYTGALGERCDGGDGRRIPPPAAHDEQRPLRSAQQAREPRHGACTRVRRRGLTGGRIGDVRRLEQHVFRQRQHHGARASGGRHRERPGHHLRDSRRILDLRDPLRQGAVHLAEIDLLKRLATHHGAADLADEQNQRGRVLMRDVNAQTWHWSRRARGSPCIPRAAG